jgi:kynurenine formamidase
MEILDLTLVAEQTEQQKTAPDRPWTERRTLKTNVWTIPAGGEAYHARVHVFNNWSMTGTYLDLPGHIVETDDGDDAATLPVERLFRVPADVIRLDRQDRSGAVTADDLAAACPPGAAAEALIVNALGDRRFDAIVERSVFLSRDAIRWIIGRRVRLLVADVFESAEIPQNVFPMLFGAGVATICCPECLGRIRAPRVRVTALPIRMRGATQIPCRFVVEVP